MSRKQIDLKFRYDVGWCRKLRIAGVVIWPYIFFAADKKTISPAIFRHELQHVYQIVSMGVFKFYLTYFWYSIRYGYEHHPLEIEAIEAALKPLTSTEELLLCKSKDV